MRKYVRGRENTWGNAAVVDGVNSTSSAAAVSNIGFSGGGI
jgi:hypothetical protein